MTSRGTHHEGYERQGEVAGSSDRSFGLVFTGVFLLLGGWSVWREDSVFWWSFAVAGVFATLSWLAPSVLGPLNRVWTLLGGVLHGIMSPVILAALYFLVFTPMGLCLRVMGKRLLSVPEAAAESYWIPREPPGPDPSTMPQQF